MSWNAQVRIGLCVIAAASGQAALAQFSFTDFSSSGSLTMNGDASIVGGNVLRTSVASGSSRGSAWYSTAQYIAAGYSTGFTFRISDRGPFGIGADGLSFAVQNVGNDVHGGMEGVLDYPLNYYGVSVDTYYNVEHSDPNDNFVGLWYQGVRVATYDLYAHGINAKDGAGHYVAITHNGADQLTVYIDSVLIAQVNGFDQGFLGGSAYVGLSSHSGAAYENHDFLNWSFGPVPEPASGFALFLGATALLRKRLKGSRLPS